MADTATDFTVFGHTVVLVLIQIGGLGYATLVTMLLLTLGRRIGLRDRMMMAEAISALNLQGLIPYVKTIVLWTVMSELVGAMLLSLCFLQDYLLAKPSIMEPFMRFPPLITPGFLHFPLI